MFLPPPIRLLLTLLLTTSTTHGAQLAFPGASGFGAYAKGGREGNNCIVSTLSDTGPGSLRNCLKEPNRIITFTVGGIIRSKDRFVIPKSTTILGQTAPSPGITTYGNGWSASGADDSIVRYIRVRMGKEGSKGKDAIGIAHGRNIIFDHVSVAWGKDETFSINGNEATNITIMNSIIGQGLQDHSAGKFLRISFCVEGARRERGSQYDLEEIVENGIESRRCSGYCCERDGKGAEELDWQSEVMETRS